MTYHTEFMIVAILNIYESMTEESSINLETLERAFYTFQDILNSKEHLETAFVFEEELENLVENIPGFSLEADELVIDDITIIYDELLLKYPITTEIDGYLDEYVQNLAIYQDLELPIPLEDTKEFFELNERILKLYIGASMNEFEGKDNRALLLTIKLLKNELEEKVDNADEVMINKIKMCLAYHNGMILSENEEHFTNSAWKVILFGNRNQLKQLSYDKLEFLCELRDTDSGEIEPIDEEDKKNKNLFVEESDPEETYEIPLFLTYFFIKLNHFLRDYRNLLSKETLEDLIIKKNLLLASSKLEKIEEHYLETGSLDTLEEPPIIEGTFTNSSFEVIKQTVTERTLSMDYRNDDIKKNPYLYPKLITNALFIRTFLDLSINQNSKDDITDLLVNNRFYKNADYTITTDIIDTFIFSGLNREKGL